MNESRKRQTGLAVTFIVIGILMIGFATFIGWVGIRTFLWGWVHPIPVIWIELLAIGAMLVGVAVVGVAIVILAKGVRCAMDGVNELRGRMVV